MLLSYRAYRNLKRLVRTVAEKFYPEIPIEIQSDAMGLIDQLDNMITGLERKQQRNAEIIDIRRVGRTIKIVCSREGKTFTIDAYGTIDFDVNETRQKAGLELDA